MMTILRLFKVDITTYLYLLLSLLAGYIKESFIIFIIIIIHELGHVFTSYILGYHIINIKIYPFGGMTVSDKRINCPLNEEILIYLSGIIAQLILLLLFLVVKDYLCFGLYIEKFVLKYNLIIIVFNLLPIYPLDGFFIIKNIFDRFFSFKMSQFIAGILSLTILFIFAILCIYYNNYLIIVILIFNNYKYYKTKNKVYNQFLLERYLYLNHHNKIVYTKNLDLKKTRRGCYHYFKKGGKLYSERVLLAKKFDIKPSF